MSYHDLVSKPEPAAQKLKGCPFCGKPPTMEYWHGGGERRRRIGCDNEACHVMPSTVGSNRLSASKKWNKRWIVPGLQSNSEGSGIDGPEFGDGPEFTGWAERSGDGCDNADGSKGVCAPGDTPDYCICCDDARGGYSKPYSWPQPTCPCGRFDAAAVKPCEMCGDAPCRGCNKCCGSKLGRDPEDGSCLGCG